MPASWGNAQRPAGRRGGFRWAANGREDTRCAEQQMIFSDSVFISVCQWLRTDRKGGSDFFDAGAAEDAGGAEEQEDDQQGEGDGVLVG